MIISALWAPQIFRFPSLWQYFQAVLAYATPPVVALFLGGFLWRGANATGAIWATALGSLTGALLFALSANGMLPLQFLNAAAVVFVTSAIVLGVVSLATRQSADERMRASALLENWRLTRLGGPTLFAAALLAVTVVVVIAFW
jgi:SSS family solute:Na+ symporter